MFGGIDISALWNVWRDDYLGKDLDSCKEHVWMVFSGGFFLENMTVINPFGNKKRVVVFFFKKNLATCNRLMVT